MICWKITNIDELKYIFNLLRIYYNYISKMTFHATGMKQTILISNYLFFLKKEQKLACKEKIHYICQNLNRYIIAKTLLEY